MSISKRLGGLAVILTVTAAVLACQPPARAADTDTAMIAKVEHRQEQMKKMGGAMKVLTRFLKNEGATIEEVAGGAAVVVDVSGRIVPELFPAGTGLGIGKSAAKPEIWNEWKDFSQKAEAVTQAASRLGDAARKGDAAAVRELIPALGKSCGACHETFRQKS